MRLRTQFIITLLLFSIILALIAASAIITNQQVDKTSRQERIAATIAQGASELSYLANDYLIYRESQQLNRWRSRFAAFSAEVASLHVDGPGQRSLVTNIQANKNRFKEVFDSAASSQESPSHNRNGAFEPAFFQVSWSRMAVQSQGLVADASRLSQLLRQQIDQLTETRTMLMYVMVGLFGLFLVVSYMLTYRRILKSIVTLRAGTAVIGSGNLDFVIEEKRHDEIGELSHAFNRMTSALKKVTASKADLEREMTERQRAEEELRESEEYYRSLFDNMLNGYAYCRMIFEEGKPQDFIYLNVNHAFGTLTGLKNVTGKKVSEVIPGVRESDPELIQIYGRVATTGVPERFETYVGALGMWFSISVYCPRKEHFVAIFDVITEQKEAERALKESEERFRQMANSIPQLAWIAQGDGYIFWYSQRWYDYTGTTPDQMAGWGWQIVHDPEILPEVLKRWKDSIATGKPFDMIFPLRGADGRFRQFLTRVLPMKDTEGRITQWFGTNTDITEQRQMEEKLSNARDELEVRVQRTNRGAGSKQ